MLTDEDQKAVIGQAVSTLSTSFGENARVLSKMAERINYRALLKAYTFYFLVFLASLFALIVVVRLAYKII